MLTTERLRELLSYDPATGLFRWLITRNGATAGTIAGSIKRRWGHRLIGIDGGYYLAHRLAWFYMTGAWPTGQLDHRNVQPDDNRWLNLREATPSQNGANTKPRRAGLKGVTLHKRTGKYQAMIKKDGIGVYLGLFETEQAAHEAYSRAADEKFGQFARAA